MSPPPLAALPGLLAGEAAIAELLGIDDAIVAVPAAARAVTLAAVAELGASPTLLVATATAREAEQLVHDLAPFLGEEAVELLPAWETLPFERVSPASETMGRRLRAMWRLRHASAGASEHGSGSQASARVIVAPIRS
ncbi:MAG: transcription-repair coupling factor, partial [Acidimicrobiales bacterium]